MANPTKIEIIKESFTDVGTGTLGRNVQAVIIQNNVVSSTGYPLTNLSNNIWIKSRSGETQAPQKQISITGPFQDGNLHIGHGLQPRTIVFEIEVWGATLLELATNLDRLHNILSPIREFPPAYSPTSFKNMQANCYSPIAGIGIRYTLSDATQRVIKGFCSVTEFSTLKRGNKYVQPLSLKFTCPSPLFYNPVPKSYETSSSTSGTMYYYGTYPDYEPILSFGANINFATAALTNQTAASVSGPSVFINSYPLYSDNQYIDFSSVPSGGFTFSGDIIIVNCATRTAASTHSTNPTAYLRDNADFTTFRIWPATYSGIQAGSGGASRFGRLSQITVTPSTGSAAFGLYSFEKYTHLESFTV